MSGSNEPSADAVKTELPDDMQEESGEAKITTYVMILLCMMVLGTIYATHGRVEISV
jgi:hypothetical protein